MTISLYIQMDDASEELYKIRKEMKELQSNSTGFACAGVVITGVIWFFFGFIIALVFFVTLELSYFKYIRKPSDALNKKHKKAYENYERISKRINRLED